MFVRGAALVVALAAAATGQFNKANSSRILVATCPRTIASNKSTVCLRNAATGAITVAAQDDPNSLRLSNQNISSIEGLPVQPHIMDLSSNRIRSINISPFSPAKVMSLNLRNNSISAAGLISLPTSLNYLDLSYNAINRMQWPAQFNWTQLPMLTTLLLNGNNLTTIDRPSFPHSLTILDLSDNNVARFQVDASTWAQLTRPGFQLLLNMSRDAMSKVPSWCSSPTSLVARVATDDASATVCVLRAMANAGPATPPPRPSSPGFSIVSLVINVVIGLALMFLASFVVVKLMERQMARQRPRGLDRDTCTSSVADESLPTQYRRSLSPRFNQNV